MSSVPLTWSIHSRDVGSPGSTSNILAQASSSCLLHATDDAPRPRNNGGRVTPGLSFPRRLFDSFRDRRHSSHTPSNDNSRTDSTVATSNSSEERPQQQQLQHRQALSIPPTFTPDSSRTDCERCGRLFTMVRRKHHCRNCGSLACADCTSTRWPAAMMPETYNVRREAWMRVCRTCHSGMEKFRAALLEGNFHAALAIFESSPRVQLFCPYAVYQYKMLPVHCAAAGGSVECVSWLTSLGCNVKNAHDAAGWTPMAHAADNGNLEVMRWLLVAMHCSTEEVTDISALQRNLHNALVLLPPPRGRASSPEPAARTSNQPASDSRSTPAPLTVRSTAPPGDQPVSGDDRDNFVLNASSTGLHTASARAQIIRSGADNSAGCGGNLRDNHNGGDDGGGGVDCEDSIDSENCAENDEQDDVDAASRGVHNLLLPRPDNASAAEALSSAQNTMDQHQSSNDAHDEEHTLFVRDSEYDDDDDDGDGDYDDDGYNDVYDDDGDDEDVVRNHVDDGPSGSGSDGGGAFDRLSHGMPITARPASLPAHFLRPTNVPSTGNGTWSMENNNHDVKQEHHVANGPLAELKRTVSSSSRMDSVGDADACIICFVNAVDAVLVPCGHCFCHSCGSEFAECPVCRHRVDQVVKTFKTTL